MIISDLNYLEVATDVSVVGGTYGLSFNKNLNSNTSSTVKFNNNTNVNVTFNKTANINVVSNVKGNSGSFAFDNEAIGYNSNTQTEFQQLVIAGKGSSQAGTVVAVAG